MSVIALATPVLAENINIIKAKNEFGGITAKVTYSPEETFFKKGIAQLIGYMNREYRLIKLETVYNQSFARIHMKEKIIEHYDQIEKNVIKLEEFYTAQYSSLFGVTRQVTCYNDNGKVFQLEKFYTRGWAGKRGVARNIVYYDKSGILLKKEEYQSGQDKARIVTYYDDKGKPLKTENYDQKGKIIPPAP